MTSARSIAAAIILGIAGTAGTAACAGAGVGTTYRCDLKSYKRHGFVPPDVVVYLEEGNRGAMVYDGFIQEVHKAPIRAQIEQIGPQKFVISWELKNVPTSLRTTIRMQSVFRLDVGRMRASFSGYVGGVANDDRGSGKCVVLKKK